MNCPAIIAQSPSTFEWLTFFFGGFMGAVLVLGIERLWSYWDLRKEREQITEAMAIEMNAGISTCDQFLQVFAANKTHIGTLPPISTAWMDRYIEKSIDFKSDNSTRLYSFIVGAKASVSQIERLEDGLRTYVATSRANTQYSEGIRNYNESIAERIGTLKSILTALLDLRSGNGMSHEAVKEHLNKT